MSLAAVTDESIPSDLIVRAMAGVFRLHGVDARSSDATVAFVLHSSGFHAREISAFSAAAFVLLGFKPAPRPVA